MLTRSLKRHIKLTAFSVLFTGLLLNMSSPSWIEADIDHFQKAINLSKLEKWQEAIPEYQLALKAEPANTLAWANLGVAHSLSGEHKEALVAFDEALKKGYDGAMFRHNRGISFAKLGLYEEAATELKAALEQNPFLAVVEHDLGLVYNKMGMHSDALQQVRKIYYTNNKLAKNLFTQITPPYAFAAVENGGSLSGQVTMSGGAPRPRSFHLIHSPNVEYCSRISDGKGHRILYDFSVSEKGGLKDTVIAILGVKKGKPFMDSQKMQSFKINRCHSDQYVMGIDNGKNLLIENLDPVEHEISTYEFYDWRRVYYHSNAQLLANTTQIRSAFVHPDAREFFIMCSLHPFLQTHALVLENPYYVITDAEGRFNISDVPPGTYEILAWHPYIPSKRGTITIKTGQEARINFEFKNGDEELKLYSDDLVGYRFQPWYDSTITFYGTTRVDDKVEVLQKPLEPTPLSRYGGFPTN